MIINLIRHGKTPGNELKRYIGRTDESLSDNGILKLKNTVYPKCQLVICSPMKRCVETCEIIYGREKIDRIIVDDFCEIDFGDFEGKNYKELSQNSDYQRWVDSGGKLDFPNGENINCYKTKVINAFLNVCEKLKMYEEISMIVHGGTIMTIMEHFEKSHEYYKWQIDNGEFITVEFENDKIQLIGAEG